MIEISQLTQAWGLKEGNEIIEVVAVQIVSVVVRLHIGTSEAHKLVVNGREVKATATFATRGTLMVRAVVISGFFITTTFIF